MSLIEKLDRPGWRFFLKTIFEYTLELIATDRSRYAGSAVDDLKSWLVIGGLTRARFRLNDQMVQRRFSLEQKLAVSEAFERLIQEHKNKLLELMADRKIAFDRRGLLDLRGVSEAQLKDLVTWNVSANNTFETMTYEHNLSCAELAKIDRTKDDWTKDDFSALAASIFNQTENE